MHFLGGGGVSNQILRWRLPPPPRKKKGLQETLLITDIFWVLRPNEVIEAGEGRGCNRTN